MINPHKTYPRSSGPYDTRVANELEPEETENSLIENLPLAAYIAFVLVFIAGTLALVWFWEK